MNEKYQHLGGSTDLGHMSVLYIKSMQANNIMSHLNKRQILYFSPVDR